MRRKFNIADEKVLPFEVLPIIEIPDLGVSVRSCRQRVRARRGWADLPAPPARAPGRRAPL
jgi:hypothetical protein